jgi:hypothetical protein
MPDEFDTNLLRMIAAEFWFSLRLQVAREFLGKNYLSLSVPEKSSVDQLVFGTISGDYQTITPDWLRTQKASEPVGFQAPVDKRAEPSQKSPKE